MQEPARDELPGVMVVDADVLVRHVLAEYLRTCGYRVIEAASSDEAQNFLEHGEVDVDVVLVDAQAPGRVGGFGFARWVREKRPGIDVVLAGAPEHAAEQAADLCEEGPHLARPYDPQSVVDRIKRLRAARTRVDEL
ncbi:response regulator [Azorhizobium doebereinerae]|uniref:response regulator n=1 Tax=Azorhizobium doebereinerae TaxID=281091 RepID=UPI00041DE5D0|nr:response regulator [Azorhizobium doebereinerae]